MDKVYMVTLTSTEHFRNLRTILFKTETLAKQWFKEYVKGEITLANIPKWDWDHDLYEVDVWEVEPMTAIVQEGGMKTKYVTNTLGDLNFATHGEGGKPTEFWVKFSKR